VFDSPADEIPMEDIVEAPEEPLSTFS